MRSATFPFAHVVTSARQKRTALSAPHEDGSGSGSGATIVMQGSLLDLGVIRAIGYTHSPTEKGLANARPFSTIDKYALSPIEHA